MKRLLFLLCLLPLLSAESVLGASVVGDKPVYDRQGPVAVTLVRILRLSGTGPDGTEQILFEDPDGFITTLDTLGRVGYQVSASNLAEGGYHTLFVDLADRYEVVSQDGIRLEKHFSESGRETHRRVRGMIMVRGGKATPLRMLNEPFGPRTMRSGGEDDDD